MRWFKRWLRYIAVLAIIVPLFLFLFLIIIDNNFHNNELDIKSYNHLSVSIPSPISSIKVFQQPFKPMFYLRRNSTGLHVNEWRSSVSFHQLLDINEFDFIKNGSKMCDLRTSGLSHPFLVALVHSSPKNFIKRDVIRKTWGSIKEVNGYKVILVFILGLVNDTRIQLQLEKEYRINRDLVQATFIDSYKNLTYKHLTSYKWVLHFCNTTKFIMKADDDAFIDIFRAVKVLRETFYSSTDNYNPRDIIACSLFPEGTLPKRFGKWSLSLNEYPYDTYPSYCSGVAYFLTLDIIYDIFEAAHRIQPVIRIDDVFLTGIVTASLNIQHFPLNLKYAYDDKRLREWLLNSNMKPSSYMVGDIGEVHDWKNLMLKLWTKTVQSWSLNDIIVR